MKKNKQGVHLVSLGCSKNLVDSEHILGHLHKAGIVYQAEPKGADAVIVNTCGFLQAAAKESMETIESFVEMKKTGNIGKIVVTGCLPQRYGKSLANKLQDVDLFLGTGNFHQIVSYLDGLAGKSPRSERLYITDPDYLYDHQTPRLQATMSHTAFIKVSEGCSRTCTFCIIPKLRGNMRSRTIDSIVKEAQQLVNSGVIEINLIAQDLTAFGKDQRPKQQLSVLLKQLAQVDGLQWIRLHYAYPHGFDDELISTIANESKILSYIDMPLQHIDNSVLKAMKRQTTAESTKSLLSKLKSGIDDLTLRTTLIVGFPGETEDAFKHLLEFLEETRFHRLGVFTYSREPGTPAHDLPNQVPVEVSEKRRHQIMELQQRISLENHGQMIGGIYQAIIEQTANPKEQIQSKHAYYGRLATQAPEIDGSTLIESDQPLKIGSIVNVRIEGVGPYDFVGKAA